MIQACGAQIVVKLLELEGIKIVAGIPGGSILPLYDELNKSSIKHVLVRHEQAAGFIAQGMARSTGKPAVCLATSGPGAMNLLTAIADARCDSVPIVAITGQVNRSLIGTDAFQEADTFGLSFPITKHSMMVSSPEDLLTAIPEAFAIAVSGRPGPVLVDIPRDVQLAIAQFERWPSIRSIRAAKHSPLAQRFCTPKKDYPKIIGAMADAILGAKKPVLYLGGGCNTKEAAAGIQGFLNELPCPVVTSLMGIGAVPSNYGGALGMVGMHGSYAANRAMHDADVVLAAGVRFDDRATGAISSFCPGAELLHIDIDAAEINKIIPASVSLVCDVESAFPLLSELIAERKSCRNHLFAQAKTARTSWFSELKKIKSETDSLELGRAKHLKKTDINPRAFISSIPQKALEAGIDPKSIIVTTDVGQHQMWSAQYYPVQEARQFLTSGSLGTMGFGLPAAIGAALVHRSKRVVCISGDGSILMNIQELATLSELGLNVTVIVLQNGSLGMVKQQQQYLFKKNYSASIFQKVPDFLEIACGFGIDAVDANTDSLWHKKAFAKGPHLVRLCISMEENVLPFVSAGKANIDALRN